VDLPGKAEISRAAQRLRGGGVVAFPTETVYGLGADALNPAAVARVFALKGRPAHNPLIVHVAGPAMAALVTAPGGWDERAQRLSRAFWPGPLSIVVPRGEGVPSTVTAGGPTVAVRCPDHPAALALLDAFGGPLVGPSANRSGRVSPTSAAHVRDEFSEDEVLVLDGGACATGIESTVVRLLEGRAEVLRPGVIGPQAIAEVLGTPVTHAGRSGADGGEPGSGSLALAPPLASPGLLSSHYAPRTPARLIATDELRAWAQGSGRDGERKAVLAYSGISLSAPHRLIAMPRSAAEYARSLYASLREADGVGAAVILVERPIGAGAVWEAVLDRLERATTRAR
jgi:L-threonylcarbamoyladenylate synthase